MDAIVAAHKQGDALRVLLLVGCYAAFSSAGLQVRLLRVLFPFSPVPDKLFFPLPQSASKRTVLAARIFFGGFCINTTAWMAPAPSLQALAANVDQFFVPLAAKFSLLRQLLGPERASRQGALRAVFEAVVGVDLRDPAAALGERGAELLARAEVLFSSPVAVVAVGAAPDPADPAAAALVARVVKVDHWTSTAGA